MSSVTDTSSQRSKPQKKKKKQRRTPRPSDSSGTSNNRIPEPFPWGLPMAPPPPFTGHPPSMPSSMPWMMVRIY